MKIKIYLLLLLIPLITNAQNPTSHIIYASDYNIFDPNELTVNSFDTIYFENLINHNAVEIDEETYNNNQTLSNGGFALYSDTFIVLSDAGTYYYICTPHAMMGMKGKIIVNQNSLIGQWYDADNGDYVEFTTDTATIYTFEDAECYEAIQFPIELTASGFNILNSDGLTNVNIFNLSDTTFSFIIDDNDTINLSTTNFNVENWVECNDSSDCFNDDETIASIFEKISLNNCDGLIYYLFENNDFNLEQACNWNGGEIFNLNNNLIMDLCECSCEFPLQELTWKCFSGSCYEISDGTGEFNSLEECETSCIISDTTWKCNEGSCIEVYNSSGEFSSYGECIESCNELTFSCIDNICGSIDDGTGEFSTLEDCEANCSLAIITNNNIDVFIYPNPSNNIFYVKLYSDFKSEILITSILGEKIYFKQINSVGKYNSFIDLSAFPKGIYNLTIKSSKQSSSQKLILK